MSELNLAGNTPILIGVGEHSDKLNTASYQQLSPTDLAALAAKKACDDALGLDLLVDNIDAIYAIRTVADSTPAVLRARLFPFGGPDNVPAAIARRLGASPTLHVYSPACGDEPQKLVGEICERLYTGQLKMALLCSGEATSTQRNAQSAGQTLDWGETLEGTLDDRHWNVGMVRSKHMSDQNLIAPSTLYPLFEQARRKRLGLSREEYGLEMGKLFAPFSEVAHANPHAASPSIHTAESIATVREDNRMVSDPYPISVVARDQVNLGAALLLTTVEFARDLGVPQNKWVFLHGYSELKERGVLERQDLSRSPAMAAAYKQAMEQAKVTSDDLRYLDLYSCFPIAVFNAMEFLGIEADDPRRLTVTGGLPFFGGPGNGYSLHALAQMMERLREDPGAFGLVGANGGYLSTHAVGIYSTTPRPFQRCNSALEQTRLDSATPARFKMDASGPGRVDTYTVLYDKQGPKEVIVIGTLAVTGERFVANSLPGDAQALCAFTAEDGLGQEVHVRLSQGTNRFAMSQASLDEQLPRPTKLLDHYEHVQVERRDHVLEVIINRPEVNNALIPEGNDELDQIFDAFEADDDLWIAIISGAGTRAFCTGNDLKAGSTGRRMWMPRNGFGGLTARLDREKPIICAVNGFAMGGGFEIALACDLVVADAAAQFALSEVRVGLLAGAGGLQRLTRQIPYKQALEIILTGRRVAAEEALKLGFINRIVEQGKALQSARDLADTLLECSPNSLRLTKQLLNEQAKYASETEAVRVPYKSIDMVVNSEDRIEGAIAFNQKRPPAWKNR